MAIAVPATRDTLANAYKALGTWISLHTLDPGQTGVSEATGGTPAYARKQTTWGASTAGAVTGTQVAIDAPAGNYPWAGLWSAASGGTFIDKQALSGASLPVQGQILVTPTYTQL
jgi:hypothetical protein